MWEIEKTEIRPLKMYYASVLWVLILEVSTFSVMKLHVTKVRWRFIFLSINKQPWKKSIMLFDDAICKNDAVWDFFLIGVETWSEFRSSLPS